MKKLTYWLVGGLTFFYSWILFYLGVEYLQEVIDRLRETYEF